MSSSARRLAGRAGLLLGLAALAACSKPAPPPAAAPAAPVRVENAALGLVFTALPAGFTVARNEGATLAFDADLKGTAATVAVAVGESEGGALGLVDRARAWGAEVQTAGGQFHGGNELVTPFGQAYTVRATVDGGKVEERRVLMAYPPDPTRLLTMTMRYPPGDPQTARDRLMQLMDLLSSMELLPTT